MSVEHKANANKLQEDQWERLYQDLLEQLKKVYPEHYVPLFGEDEMKSDNDFTSEKKRRIEQFARALQPMSHRAANVVKDCCFLRIEERHADASAKPTLQESKQLERAPALAVSDSMDSNYECSHPDNDFPDEGWRQDHRTKRYVQFVFLAKHFEIDLPRPTL